MILHKKYAYAREPLATRTCPVCHFTDDLYPNCSESFIVLETVYNRKEGDRVKLYACPKCGTVGIDVCKIEYES